MTCPAVPIPSLVEAISRPLRVSWPRRTSPVPPRAIPALARCSRPALMREPTGAGMCPSTICRPGPMCFVAADSYHSGRFAVLVLPGDLVSGGLAGLPPTRVVPQEVGVVTPGDSGFTWSQPATFGDEPVAHITNRPWIAYTSVQQGRNGPTGVLAVLWRNAYPPYNRAAGLVPGTQNRVLSLSPNHRTTLTDPDPPNSAPTPPP